MSNNSQESKDIETRDSEKVNEAIRCIVKRDLDTAHRLLLEVIENTPTDYVNEFIEGETLFIKFWDKEQFLHYVNWYKRDLKYEKIIWIMNAYPRAYFYLGYMMMEAEEWEKAIEYLEKGHALEKTNPTFLTEMALAHGRLGSHKKALELYRQSQTVNTYTRVSDRATALRGEGFVRIEMGDLDGAGYAYREALKIGEEKKLIRQQLKYIEHLRSGGKPVQPNILTTGEPKRWWQFWK